MNLCSFPGLQLFAEASAGDTGVTAPDAGVQGVKQEADTAQLPQIASDPEAEFEELIRGKYKQQYNARVQDIVQKRLKSQNKTHEQTAASQNQQRLEQAKAQYDQWMAQAQQARELYPTLELDQEIRNPRFQSLLRAGVEVADAYLVLHRDDIIPAAMHYTAKAVEEKLANRIAANGIRPSENGMSAQGTLAVKDQISHMTRAQRQDIIRRVRQGEIISF